MKSPKVAEGRSDGDGGKNLAKSKEEMRLAVIDTLKLSKGLQKAGFGYQPAIFDRRFGLFLNEEDWQWLTGPAKYRRPEHSEAICTARNVWPWPTAIIGGNHGS